MLAIILCRIALKRTTVASSAILLRGYSDKRASDDVAFIANENRVGTPPDELYSRERITHFGNEDVNEAEKAERVFDVFKNVAATYDLMNDAMSMGIHRCWKDTFVQRLRPTPGIRLLDMAGGTGDIAFRVMKRLSSSVTSNAEDSEVVVGDINPNMLEVGRQRAVALGHNQGIRFEVADAEHLPFADDTFDAYTIAFGIRNCVHVETVLQEAWRVLRVGGRFMCMEFSHVENPIARWFYDQYSFQVIPAMGMVLTRDWRSYQYLVESIRKFPKQEELKTMIEEAGFCAVDYDNLALGVVAIHSGFKL